MSKKPKLMAAGAVVLQAGEDGPEVLAVHRPEYQDWSLPKGKPEPDEDLPAVAVREVEEETGLRVQISRPLSRLSYKTAMGRKVTSFWQGSPVRGEVRFEGTKPRIEKDGRKVQEVDQVRWIPLAEIDSVLTYPAEREVVRLAAASEPGPVVILVRHGKAMERKNWSGKDWKRPLSARGRRQARRVAPLLDAYGVDAAVSSSSTRCVQTLQPFAERTGLPIQHVHDLSEESYKADPKKSRATMRKLVQEAITEGRATAFCGHRPVIPMMREELGIPVKPMLVGEATVIHYDPSGDVYDYEIVKSAF